MSAIGLLSYLNKNDFQHLLYQQGNIRDRMVYFRDKAIRIILTSNGKSTSRSIL